MKRYLLVVGSLALLWFAGCNLLDQGTGIQKGPDGKPVSTGQGPVQTGLGVLGMILSPLGFGWVSTAALAAVKVYDEIRVSNWKGAALATAGGVQDVIGKLDAAHQQTPIAPASAADMIKVAVDAAHDAAKVPQPIQNVLSPTT